MSLAVSAVIAPSRRLRCLLAGFCAALCAAALAVGLLLPERFAVGGAVASVPLLAALSLLRLFFPVLAGWPSCITGRRDKHSSALLHSIATVRRIDISGLGQLRLTVQQQLGEGAAAGRIAAPGTLMTLLPGATVWPCCILLRLRADDGAVWPLVLLPDSVAGGQYRALAVAVRALAGGHSNNPDTKQGELIAGGQLLREGRQWGMVRDDRTRV